MTRSRRCGGLLDQCHFQSGFLGRLGAAGRTTKPDDYVDAAVLEVQRLRPALVAVAENGDALPRERGHVDVAVAEQLHGRSLRA